MSCGIYTEKHMGEFQAYIFYCLITELEIWGAKFIPILKMFNSTLFMTGKIKYRDPQTRPL